MQIGEIIRKYRKEQNMTQEEMANRLGVTTPAVNKWEKGNTYPDIRMLAPIARLLGISLDTLLSFHEELSNEEISRIVQELDTRLKQGTYEEAFQWAKTEIERYPNCKMLIWQLASILDAQRLFYEVSDGGAYDNWILSWYEQALESKEEEIRIHAADSLFSYSVRAKEYEKAEKYLAYFSEQNPERKAKYALILSRTNRKEEAYKAYEELLFSEYQMASRILQSIYLLAMEDGDMDKAHRLVEKQQELAGLFEMGTYHEVSCGLELATVEKDADAVVCIMEKMLESVEGITDFTESKLYEHMTFQKSDRQFADELKKNLLACFRDEETYGFLSENERWRKLIQ